MALINSHKLLIKLNSRDCDELTRADNEYMKYYNWSHSEQSGRLTFEGESLNCNFRAII